MKKKIALAFACGLLTGFILLKLFDENQKTASHISTVPLVTFASDRIEVLKFLAGYEAVVWESWTTAQSDLRRLLPRITVQIPAGKVDFFLEKSEQGKDKYLYHVNGTVENLAVAGILEFQYANQVFSNVEFRPGIIPSSVPGPQYMVLQLPSE